MKNLYRLHAPRHLAADRATFFSGAYKKFASHLKKKIYKNFNFIFKTSNKRGKKIAFNSIF